MKNTKRRRNIQRGIMKVLGNAGGSRHQHHSTTENDVDEVLWYSRMTEKVSEWAIFDMKWEATAAKFGVHHFVVQRWLVTCPYTFTYVRYCDRNISIIAQSGLEHWYSVPCRYSIIKSYKADLDQCSASLLKLSIFLWIFPGHLNRVHSSKMIVIFTEITWFSYRI